MVDVGGNESTRVEDKPIVVRATLLGLLSASFKLHFKSAGASFMLFALIWFARSMFLSFVVYVLLDAFDPVVVTMIMVGFIVLISLATVWAILVTIAWIDGSLRLRLGESMEFGRAVEVASGLLVKNKPLTCFMIFVECFGLPNVALLSIQIPWLVFPFVALPFFVYFFIYLLFFGFHANFYQNPELPAKAVLTTTYTLVVQKDSRRSYSRWSQNVVFVLFMTFFVAFGLPTLLSIAINSIAGIPVVTSICNVVLSGACAGFQPAAFYATYNMLAIASGFRTRDSLPRGFDIINEPSPA